MRKLSKRFLCLLLSFAFVCSFAPSSFAKEQKTVRVGWYESAFHSTDQFGRRSGYGYEYQQRIAIYTGWTYEYVEGSWSQLLEMLIAGEIDLLSDVSYTEERAEKILYSSEAMGSEGYHVFIAPGNTEIRADDFSTLNGKRVGVNKNSIQEKLFIDWARSHDVSPEIVESTERTPTLLEMLANGEFDALVTLDTYGNSADVVPVCKVGFAESFFGINKNRPDLKRELDVAMNRLFEDNRDFNQTMTEKFNKSSSVNSFLTVEEIEWLESHPTIRVGYRDDFLPYCDLDETTGLLTGSLSDYLAFAETCERNARLSFEACAFDTTEKALLALTKGEIDCLFPINLSSYDGEQLGVIITDPFVVTEMYAVVRTADRQGISAEREMSVAVLKGHPSHETFLKDNFPNWTITYYDSTEESFQAVASSAVDYTLVSNYRINRISDLCAKYKLSTLTTGETVDLAFATRAKDDCLYSIINKIIRLVPDTTLNSSLTNYSFSDEKISFADFIREYFVYFVAVIATVAVVILMLIQRNMRTAAKAEEGRRIISEAERDPLTNLYNWNFFLVYANRLRREHPEKPMDAVVMNIERFHSVNALHGREFGDRVLRELGEEIQQFLQETEGIASRFEADRFDIYCKHREDWEPQFERFQARLKGLSHDANIQLRMGVKPWQEDMEPVQQFDRARTACNKVRGSFTQVMIYDAEMGKREERDQRLLNDISRALEQQEFEIHYQPKFDIQSEQPRLSSAEALVRWLHPELGLISPDEFIPLIERSGQITALDNYVWQKAAQQIAAWRERYGVTVPVSVNLSRVDVFDPSLAATLDGIVKKNGLKHQDLKLEVTESAYTENADEVIRVIELLRGKGYEIEMDDFGSGYSSLNMLSSMPIDVLKMDIAFIRNIERNEKDLRLVELIVDIARYLKVPVVAEGVETENQLKLLKAAGCNLVQGYYLSRPLPAEEFERKMIAGDRRA
ncbi:MAG: EAL domain-containing protein [Clostridia bacterium]|nr:EAL domain-containing protein [Clostridia bacterium]MBR0408208.1 EAL domain-containing protein [Clostridia bacterium]